MGPTHHALEDISAMNSLGLDVFVPAFDHDIDSIIDNCLSLIDQSSSKIFE